MTEMVQCLREQFIERLEPIDISDDTDLIHVRSSHSRVRGARLAVRDDVSVQGDRPFPDLGLNFAPSPEPALDELGADFCTELLPDLVSAGSEDLPEQAHLDLSSSLTARRRAIPRAPRTAQNG